MRSVWIYKNESEWESEFTGAVERSEAGEIAVAVLGGGGWGGGGLWDCGTTVGGIAPVGRDCDCRTAVGGGQREIL